MQGREHNALPLSLEGLPGPTTNHNNTHAPHLAMFLHLYTSATSPCSLCWLTPCLYFFFFLFSTDFLFCGLVTMLSPPPLLMDVQLSSPSKASHHDHETICSTMMAPTTTHMAQRPQYPIWCKGHDGNT